MVQFGRVRLHRESIASLARLTTTKLPENIFNPFSVWGFIDDDVFISLRSPLRACAGWENNWFAFIILQFEAMRAKSPQSARRELIIKKSQAIRLGLDTFLDTKTNNTRSRWFPFENFYVIAVVCILIAAYLWSRSSFCEWTASTDVWSKSEEQPQ